MIKPCHAVGWFSVNCSIGFLIRMHGAHHCEVGHCSIVHWLLPRVDENQHESPCLNFKTHLPWSCQFKTVSWIVCVVEVPCNTIPCWTTLTLESRSAPISWYMSLFNLEMYFLPVQTSADFGRHSNMLCLLVNINVFGTHQPFTFFSSKCSWIIVLTLPFLMLRLDAL